MEAREALRPECRVPRRAQQAALIVRALQPQTVQQRRQQVRAWAALILFVGQIVKHSGWLGMDAPGSYSYAGDLTSLQESTPP